MPFPNPSRFLSGILCLLLLVAGSCACAAQSGPAAGPKNIDLGLSALEKSSDGGSWAATLTLRVADQHLVYRHSLAFNAGSTKIRAVWPEALEKPDPFEGTMVKVYPPGEHLFSLQFTPDLSVVVSTLVAEYQGCSSSTCFMPAQLRWPLEFARSTTPSGPPVTRPVAVAEPASEAGSPAASGPGPHDVGTGSPAPGWRGSGEPVSLRAVTTPAGQTDFKRLIEERGIFWTLLIAFLGGLLVSLTPCVYPMIPITLSIIGGRRENTSLLRGFSLSVTYVAGLSITYALLGLLVAGFGAQVRGILQGATFQLIMAGIFALLALSMFDLFMIEAPAFLRSRLAGVQGSGPGGIFLLGMLSGLMASPCVAAPLAGILAFIAASGSLGLGFLMLLAFAWGMGILLIIIGTFSGAIGNLPRAGEWMNRVKEFYGFLLAGAALYFARPVIGAPWTDLGVAVLLAAFSAFLGLFTPPADTDRLLPRVFKTWGVLTLVVACAFALSAVSHWGGLAFPVVGGKTIPGGKTSETAGLLWHDRLEDALKAARAEGRPVFVDFRADWCTICKELEAEVFPDPEVQPWLARMTLLKVDCTRNEGEPAELMKRFGIIGLPTLLILDPDGQERTGLRLIGGTDPKGLLAVLRKALE